MSNQRYSPSHILPFTTMPQSSAQDPACIVRLNILTYHACIWSGLTWWTHWLLEVIPTTLRSEAVSPASFPGVCFSPGFVCRPHGHAMIYLCPVKISEGRSPRSRAVYVPSPMTSSVALLSYFARGIARRKQSHGGHRGGVRWMRGEGVM